MTFKVQATATIRGSSLDGQRVVLWTGRTRRSAEKALARIQCEVSANYTSFTITEE